jgi:hypothetical protein
VIETSEAVESKSFWEQISQSMTINERRAIFKEIAKHLEIAVDEWGNIEDETKKQFSLDEAKAILKPYREIEISSGTPCLEAEFDEMGDS